MSLDLSMVKSIDVHTHPFVPNETPYKPAEFLEQLSLAVVPGMFDQKITSGSTTIYSGLNMYMHIAIQRLAEYYSCEPTIESVVEKRNEYAKQFPTYTKKLFKDVKLSGMIVDYGFPTPRIPAEEFEGYIGIPTWEVYRIEPVMDRIREEHNNFTDFIEAFRDDLRNALQEDHVLGLKSIIAYRSGLNVQRTDEKVAAEQYSRFKQHERALVQGLRDYCLYVAMEECTRANKAMHIHTGVGDGEILLDKSNPSLLVNMLREESFVNTKVHLVHGGYPWMEEAAFLCNILPNVYMDISLQVPFAGHGGKRIISHVLEFAPFNKVMFGTDAFTIPEMNWSGVLIFKEQLQEVLTEWIEQGYMDHDFAYLVAEMILYKNAVHLYDLKI